jgi:hypothetical protein
MKIDLKEEIKTISLLWNFCSLRPVLSQGAFISDARSNGNGAASSRPRVQNKSAWGRGKLETEMACLLSGQSKATLKINNKMHNCVQNTYFVAL